MDLYQHLGQSLRTLPFDANGVESPLQLDARPPAPSTVLTKVVETTDEGRSGSLLGLVAP
ncbi:MAG: hypothetical protein ACRDRP_22655 [Pseudonocardiaceae bacterium]